MAHKGHKPWKSMELSNQFHKQYYPQQTSHSFFQLKAMVPCGTTNMKGT
jgi:hypothetical protein